ncbi:protein Boi2p [[Candida] jaroonii]|uniref:Protein Boi2p n=1 Tax=[Candida] jaroonii TaxID=467808 RepID=A0ACA9YBF1_9ASCO|nr:protein Boi2p [[Candida] jaroonii]
MTMDNLYLCIKQFNSRLGDELNLKVGDKIEVLADDSEYNDGWYMGKNLSTGEAGLYPKSFTQILVTEGPPQPKLLRSRSRRLNNLNSPNSTFDEDSRPNSVLITPKQYGEVNKTMDDIDKALEELQVSVPSNQSYPQVNDDSNANISSSSINNSNGNDTTSGTVDRSSITDLNPKDAINWNPSQVTSYFALVLGFDTNIAGKFSRHKITGEILFQLDLSHLKELDIDSFGTRFEIFKEIEKLKKLSNGSSDDIKETKPNYNEVKTPQQVQPDLSMERDSRGRDNIKSHSRQRSQSLDKLNTNFKFGEPTLDRPASSIYDSVHSHSRQHSRQQSKDVDYYHKRNSSVLSNLDYNNYHHRKNSSKFSFGKEEKLISPAKIRKDPYANEVGQGYGQNNSSNGNINTIVSISDSTGESNKSEDVTPIDDIQLSPKKNSISSPIVTSLQSNNSSPAIENKNISRFKTLKTASTQNFKNFTSSKKSKTSAFQEGIRNITPDEAIKTANYSGFMAKRSGNNLSWRSRYFTLHGTRLSYFTSLKDKKERGLIDITAHKVIPISTEGEDKYIALYASSTGLGRYCFKIVPPAPGFKKGLTFTQPKVHYFAVDTADEMRGWMKALMTSTIDIDDSVPVVSSCSTPTVSLAKAQELLAKAREETKLKDIDNEFSEAQLTNFIGNYTLDPNSSGENSPLVETNEDRLRYQAKINNSHSNLSHYTNGSSDPYQNHQTHQTPLQPPLNVNVNIPTSKTMDSPNTPTSQSGFASPYLLASGLLSPKSESQSRVSTINSAQHPHPTNRISSSASIGNHSTGTSIIPSSDHGSIPGSNNGSALTTPVESKDYFEVSPKKKRGSEKLMAYSNDGSGNHTFFIKQKK